MVTESNVVSGTPVAGRLENRAKTKSNTLLTVIGLAVALVFPLLPVTTWVNEFGGIPNLLAYEAIWWAAIGFVLAYVLLVERRPLSSMGFRPMQRVDWITAIASAFVMVAGLATIFYVVFPLLGIDEGARLSRLFATPLWWRLISVIRAAVGEEVLFRGYAVERLGDVTGSTRLAAIISWAIFTAAHVGPWGWGHLLVAGFGGLVLTALYLWRRNLWTNIVAHALVDGVGVVAG